MTFDLHTHSDCSDGTEPPRAVVAAAAAAGLPGLGLTDHDTTVGWVEAERAAEEHGIALIRGMELSCSTDTGISVHVLSYLHDPTYQPLLDEISKARSSRIERAKEMTRLLSEDFPIDWDLVLQHTHEDATVGRPHLADALVSVGAVENRSAAFRTILRGGSKYYVPHYAVDPVRGVELIRDAGGVPIFAHPAASARGRIVSDEIIHDMIDAGLAGLEIYHRDNPPEGRERLAAIAREHDLLVTGSSDYHGTGKPNSLGENTTTRETVVAIEELAGSATRVLWNGH